MRVWQGKDSERDEVLMSYRALNEERSRLEANYERALSECHELKGQVYAREEELQVCLCTCACTFCYFSVCEVGVPDDGDGNIHGFYFLPALKLTPLVQVSLSSC